MDGEELRQFWVLLNNGVISRETWKEKLKEFTKSNVSPEYFLRDSIYPFGIDDLELIDGVYQSKN